MPDPSSEALVDCVLGRIVIRDGADRQYIYVEETAGERGFPIVIGNSEAGEIHRVVHGIEPDRPLTHQLALSMVEALDVSLHCVDIVALKQNTFYARILLEDEEGEVVAKVDARPSDAIALALRSGCPLRVAEQVLVEASKTEGEL